MTVNNIAKFLRTLNKDIAFFSCVRLPNFQGMPILTG